MEVEVDLMFWSTHTNLHLVACCIGWSAALIIARRRPQDILNGIAHIWIRLFGPMRVLTSDKEGALDLDIADAWVDRWDIRLNLRPRGARARTVERRNALLRDAVHKVSAQLERWHSNCASGRSRRVSIGQELHAVRAW
eukprot:8428902-Pyramimonas_sp.AAC.1